MATDNHVVAGEAAKATSEKLLFCSFCGKSQHEVRKLIAGPSVHICDECIALCSDIVKEDTKSQAMLGTLGRRLSVRLGSFGTRLYHGYKSMSQSGVEFVFWAVLATIVLLQVVTLLMVLAK